MITDDNTLEDMGGVIWCLQADLEDEAPEFPLAPRFEKLLERIELKLSKNKGKIRHNWFSTALTYAKAAQVAFARGQASEADENLSKCWEYLEQGNKAHRSKTAFIVAQDGTTYPTKPEQGAPPNSPGLGSLPCR